MANLWLLLTIALLIVVCVTLYQRLRQLESTFHTRQSLVADELRGAETALLAAVRRIEAIDARLEAREARLAQPPADLSQLGGRGGDRETRGQGDKGTRGQGDRDAVPTVGGSRRHGDGPKDQREQAARLARTGRTTVQIARALGLRVGEVELLLALSERPEVGARREIGAGYPTRSR